jgi:putative spermidine/putrescine transport system substrate-binding protein
MRSYGRGGPALGRRWVVLGAAAGALAAPLAWRRPALAQDKPAELIVRAWGGVWVEALEKGVSRPFTEATGIAVRHDLTEDNEIRPKIWAAVDQGRAPPIHVNWDTTTNAMKSALRGVTEDLSDLPNLAGMLPAARPQGVEGVPVVNMYSYVYVLAYRDEAFPGGAPGSWQVLYDPKHRGRIALYDDGIGFHFVAQRLGGGRIEDIPGNMEPAWEAIRRLKEQRPLLGEDPDFTAWFQNGEIDLACTILSNARAARQNGVKVSWTVPEEGCKVDTDGMWVPKGLPENERRWAKEYVNFAMTQEAQQAWTSGLGLPGLRPGLTPPEDLKGDAAYPTRPEDFARLISIPGRVQVQHEADWFKRFNEIMQG